MKYYDKLDLILKEFYNKKDFISSETLHKSFINSIDIKEITMIINKLSSDNLIEKIISNADNVSKIKPPYSCRITYSGLLFFERGGYNNKNSVLRLNHNWKIAKTIANAANAVIIIIIASVGIYVSYESNKKNGIIKLNEFKIDSLNTVIRTFDYKIINDSIK